MCEQSRSKFLFLTSRHCFSQPYMLMSQAHYSEVVPEVLSDWVI